MKNNTYQKSLEMILSHSQPLAREEVSFHQALGRVLAEDVLAKTNDPPAAKSAMDGFCLRASDTQNASADQPIIFPFSGALGAGHLPAEKLNQGSALRIMTGALLPEGADAVVKQEDTRLVGDQTIALETPLTPGENVIAQGRHMKLGEGMLFSGEWISPQVLGILAKLGKSHLQVHRQPRIALLAIGDELVAVDQPLKLGQLHVSNLYSMAASILQYGGIPQRLGVAKDDPNQIENLLRPYIPDLEPSGHSLPADIIITLGGSSRGDFDFAHTVFERLSATIHFRRTNLNLGPSTIFATLGNTLFFGLPGTPVPSWGAFELLLRPALLKMAGQAHWFHPLLQAHLTAKITARAGQSFFVPGWLAFETEGLPRVTPLRTQNIGTQPSALLANALIEVPENQTEVEEGVSVSVKWIGSGQTALSER